MTAKATRSYRVELLVAALFGAGLLAMGCQSSCTRDADAPSEPVAQGALESRAADVNGVVITKETLDTLHGRAVEQFKRTGRAVSAELERNMRGSILRKLIDDEIISQKAKAEGVQVDRFERVEALEKYKENMGGPKGFQAFLEHQNLTEEQVQKTVIAELARDKLVQKLSAFAAPSEEEIKKHYEANERLYTLPPMVRARHILIKLSANDPPEKAELVLKKANQVFAEAQAPGANFEALVQKYSEGPSVKQGGDLGLFPRGRMVKEFEDVAFGAPLKKAQAPIKTDFGYHIIYVEEKQGQKVAPLAEVKDRIVEAIKRNKRGRKTEDLLAEWRKKAKVTIYDASMTPEEYKALSQENKVAEKTEKKK